MIETRTINRIKRVTALIDENAKQATPGPWSVSHSHLIGFDEKTKKSFDIASQPYKREHCVYGVHPDAGGWGFKDMRYMATVSPITMTRLTADVRELLDERENVTALATKIADLLGNTMGADESDRAKALLDAVETYLMGDK